MALGEDACAPALRAYGEYKKKPWRRYALAGGEDYGLIFTAPAKNLGRIKKLLPGARVVGRLEKGSRQFDVKACRPKDAP